MYEEWLDLPMWFRYPMAFLSLFGAVCFMRTIWDAIEEKFWWRRMKRRTVQSGRTYRIGQGPYLDPVEPEAEETEQPDTRRYVGYPPRAKVERSADAGSLSAAAERLRQRASDWR